MIVTLTTRTVKSKHDNLSEAVQQAVMLLNSKNNMNKYEVVQLALMIHEEVKAYGQGAYYDEDNNLVSLAIIED